MPHASFVLPYSSLLLQVLGVLLVGVVLRAYVKLPLAVATALSAGLLVLVLTLPALWQSTAQDTDAARAGLATPPGVAAQEKCLVDQGTPHLIAFVAWLRAHLPQDAVYTGVDDTCVAYQLLPRLPARPGQAADWLIYLDGLPPAARRRARREAALPPSRRTVFVAEGTLGARRLLGGAG